MLFGGDSGCKQIFAPLLVCLAVAGCVQAARIEDDRLMRAGFIKVPADTPGWLAVMNSLPPHRFVHRKVNGVPAVYYSDPIACKCVYSGNEETRAKFAVVSEMDVTKFDEYVSTN